LSLGGHGEAENAYEGKTKGKSSLLRQDKEKGKSKQTPQQKLMAVQKSLKPTSNKPTYYTRHYGICLLVFMYVKMHEQTYV